MSTNGGINPLLAEALRKRDEVRDRFTDPRELELFDFITTINTYEAHVFVGFAMAAASQGKRDIFEIIETYRSKIDEVRRIVQSQLH